MAIPVNRSSADLNGHSCDAGVRPERRGFLKSRQPESRHTDRRRGGTRKRTDHAGSNPARSTSVTLTLERISMEIIATIIAKGAPNRCSDGSTTMCAIGVSEELGLIRLYPLSVSDDRLLKIWTRVKCTCEKSRKDNRHESWKVLESRFDCLIESRNEKVELLDACILRSGTDDPIEYQNKLRRSICIVKVDGRLGGSIEARSDHEPHVQTDAEDSWVMPQNAFPFKPYLHWTSVQGTQHKTHLLGQEVYYALLRNEKSPFRIFENMSIGDPAFVHWIVLGNMKDRRNVWVAAHLHRLKTTKQEQPRLPFATNDRKCDAWPYLTQEQRNAKESDPQMQFSFCH